MLLMPIKKLLFMAKAHYGRNDRKLSYRFRSENFDVKKAFCNG